MLLGRGAKDPAQELVERATSDLLISEDYGASLEVSDFSNASSDHAALVAAALSRRLRSRKSQEVLLTLSLVDVCVKNATEHALAALGGGKARSHAREFARASESASAAAAAATAAQGPGVMHAVALVAERRSGPDSGSIFAVASSLSQSQATAQAWLNVQQRALSLLQELGQLFEDRRAAYPDFFDCYARLTAKGIIFPIADGAGSPNLGPTRPAAFGAPSQVPPPSSAGAVRAADVDKLEHDVSVLTCKLDVADHLLAEPEEDLLLEADEVLDVLDFLLQCKPRMVELIEASALGLLSDKFMESALTVNDRLCNTVERLKGNAPRTQPQPPPSAEPRAGRRRSSNSTAAVPILKAPTRQAMQAHSRASAVAATATATATADLLDLGDFGGGDFGGGDSGEGGGGGGEVAGSLPTPLPRAAVAPARMRPVEPLRAPFVAHTVTADAMNRNPFDDVSWDDADCDCASDDGAAGAAGTVSETAGLVQRRRDPDADDQESTSLL